MEINIDEFKGDLRSLVGFVQSNLSNLNPESKAKFSQFLKLAESKISSVQQSQVESPSTQTELVPDSARLLWVASGGDIRAFVNFIGQYPDPDLQAIATNSARLKQVIEILQGEIPEGIPVTVDGMESAWLPSSNIWGFEYDKNSKKLKVKFNGKRSKDDGPVYEYDNVPPVVAQIVESGAIPAKTTGSNRWGTWWKSKSPSLGSSVSALLKNGGYSYRKLS